jgi:hypothetical protein
MKWLRPDAVYHTMRIEMGILCRVLSPRFLLVLTVGLSMLQTKSADAQAVAYPYFTFGNGYGILNGPAVTVTQHPNSGDIPLMGGAAGCCAEGGYALDLRLGVKLLNVFAIEGGVIGQGWNIGADSRGGTGFGGGGVRLYLLGGMEELLGKFDLPFELSIGSLFGYTIIGKDFAYTGSFVGFDGTFEWFIADFFSLAFRINLFTPYYDDFVFTDFDGERGRCLDSTGANTVAGIIHSRGSMTCDGGSPDADFISPQLVVNFYLDVF